MGAAKSKLSSLKGELKESKSNLESSTQTLTEFVDGALSTFNELRHGPKVEEEPVQEDKTEEQVDEKSEEKPDEKMEEKVETEAKEDSAPTADEPAVESNPVSVAVAAETETAKESPKKDLDTAREEVEPTNA